MANNGAFLDEALLKFFRAALSNLIDTRKVIAGFERKREHPLNCNWNKILTQVKDQKSVRISHTDLREILRLVGQADLIQLIASRIHFSDLVSASLS